MANPPQVINTRFAPQKADCPRNAAPVYHNNLILQVFFNNFNYFYFPFKYSGPTSPLSQKSPAFRQGFLKIYKFFFALGFLALGAAVFSALGSAGSSDVQCGQRVALMSMVDMQYGHCLVVGAAASAASSFFSSED